MRVRHRDGLPIMHLTTYVPDAIGRTYDRADMETTPLYELLRRAGRGYRRAEQRIGAALADPTSPACCNWMPARRSCISVAGCWMATAARSRT